MELENFVLEGCTNHAIGIAVDRGDISMKQIDFLQHTSQAVIWMQRKSSKPPSILPAASLAKYSLLQKNASLEALDITGGQLCTITLSDCVFKDNSVSNAVIHAQYSVLKLQKCRFEGNSGTNQSSTNLIELEHSGAAAEDVVVTGNTNFLSLLRLDRPLGSSQVRHLRVWVGLNIICSPVIFAVDET